MKSWLFLCIAIIAEIAATSALKASDGFTRFWPSIIVCVGYGIAFYFLSLALRVIPVGVAYAIWSGAGIVVIAAIGWFFFEQRLDLPAIVGIGLILAGVIVMNVFSKAVSH